MILIFRSGYQPTNIRSSNHPESAEAHALSYARRCKRWTSIHGTNSEGCDMLGSTEPTKPGKKTSGFQWILTQPNWTKWRQEFGISSPTKVKKMLWANNTWQTLGFICAKRRTKICLPYSLRKASQAPETISLIFCMCASFWEPPSLYHIGNLPLETTIGLLGGSSHLVSGLQPWL